MCRQIWSKLSSHTTWYFFTQCQSFFSFKTNYIYTLLDSLFNILSHFSLVTSNICCNFIDMWVYSMSYDLMFSLTEWGRHVHSKYCWENGHSYNLLYRYSSNFFNTFALRKAKIVFNFGLSECNRVKQARKGWAKSVCKTLFRSNTHFTVQSTLVISKSKGPAETLRDIRTSTYQMCRIEENTKRTTKFHKWTCNLTPLIRNICWKYCGKGEKLLLRSNFSPYPQYLITWW